MWTRFEPVHAVTYFSAEARGAYEAVGLRGYWRGYFAGRAAPLGAVEAAPVITMFHGFAPTMVERALPDAWGRATPEQTLAARADGAEAALARVAARIGVDATTLTELADLAETAVELLEPDGHPLGAANAALPRDPEASPLRRLWQVTTTLREDRGDAHVAALVAHGFDGVESAVWRTDPGDEEEMRQYRGWTADEWAAGVARLTERGWLDDDGRPTPAGEAAYAAVEAETDASAGAVWAAFGPDRTERLLELLTPLASATYAEIPVNPMHVPDPATI